MLRFFPFRGQSAWIKSAEEKKRRRRKKNDAQNILYVCSCDIWRGRKKEEILEPSPAPHEAVTKNAYRNLSTQPKPKPVLRTVEEEGESGGGGRR